MNRVSAGRAGHNWRKLVANLKAQRQPCWLCGMAIDYTLRYPHPESFSADHKVPLSVDRRLAEVPGNVIAAHLRCNVSRGDRDPKPSIGQTSRRW